MCGIFGLITTENTSITEAKFSKITKRLFLLSESRGKEASGFALVDKDEIAVYKSPLPASELVSTNVFKDQFPASRRITVRSVIGHSRLATNGYEHFNKNNQPVVKNNLVVIHNGIIVNHKQIWEELAELPESDLDTEVVNAFLHNQLISEGYWIAAFKHFYNKLFGMASLAVLSSECDYLFLATNNGSLYFVSDKGETIFIFASERNILQTILKKEFGKNSQKFKPIEQLKPNIIFAKSLKNGDLKSYESDSYTEDIEYKSGSKYTIASLIRDEVERHPVVNTSFEYKSSAVPQAFENAVNRRLDEISELRRCTKCILPESFPFITFDKDGVCNYCTYYSQVHCFGEKALLEFVDNNRKSNGEPECLVPFSGGRDSSFVLHYLVKVLGIKPLAFSYDWGMITDLARRNQSRLCGELGVEHILVSADIRRKRENIRKNVSAWLKRPVLGMVPIFMAGDKQYFFYTAKLMKQNNLSISFLGENLLETTNFKSGFAGIEPNFLKDKTYSLSLNNKIKMLTYYAFQYMRNPNYINSSLIDTLGSFNAYYLIKHNNINLFNYIEWDEQKIIGTLQKYYNWESDPGTKSTWRIGDGTAAFYNYIYLMMAGFTENDTFRSNQVRENQLSREEALRIAEQENYPRWDSLQWYCKTISLDFPEVISRINSVKQIY